MRIDNKTPLEVTPTAPVATPGKPKRGKKPTVEVLQTRKTVHILDILDSSGSMSGSKYIAAKQGLLSKLEQLSKDVTVDYVYSLFEFGDQQTLGRYRYEQVTNSEALKIAKNLTCMNTGTALTDAIITTLSRVKTTFNTEINTLVSILTDGQECSSKEHDPKVAGRLIKEVQEKFNTTVTFVATERDIQFAINLYDIDKSNTLVHDNTSASILRASAVGATATLNYSKSLSRGIDVSVNFYSQS